MLTSRVEIYCIDPDHVYARSWQHNDGQHNWYVKDEDASDPKEEYDEDHEIETQVAETPLHVGIDKVKETADEAEDKLDDDGAGKGCLPLPVAIRHSRLPLLVVNDAHPHHHAIVRDQLEEEHGCSNGAHPQDHTKVPG